MLLRVSDETEARILTRLGVAVVALVVVVIVIVRFVVASGRTPNDAITVAIKTPYVGQGVTGGTPVIMHGVKVGEISKISSLPGGGVRLDAKMLAGPTSGLTDAMGIDFRPANYFGVTGVNLIPNAGGRPLRNGAEIHITPKGNFVLQTLLYRLGQLTKQVITQRLVDVIDRATRYTDALNPLLETMITVSTTVTDVQTVDTAQLLRNATGITVAFPGFVDALIHTGDLYLRSNIGVGYNPDDDLKTNPYVSTYDAVQSHYYNEARHALATNPDAFVDGRLKEWLKGGETDLFSKVGHLLSTHIYELFPVVDEIRVMADVVPKLVPAKGIANTLHELRTRLERMFAGSGDQRALQVRLILDELPGVAAPMGLALGAAG